MTNLVYMLVLWTVCDGVFTSEEQKGFVQPLDFGPIFDSGVTSLASNPIAAAVLKVDKSQYPQLFDTIVSSSIDSLQTRVAPSENRFSAEHFGFNPIASQSFVAPVKTARYIAQPRHQKANEQFAQPLKYDIRTVHDADYKVYKPEENEQGEEILTSLKNNPTVAAYFKPAVTNLEIAHPLKYRKEEVNNKNNENIEIEQNYSPNAYITGPARIRRYTTGRQRENLRKHSDEEEDDPYNYKPKAFDSDAYRSAYTEEKDPNKDYDYAPYSYDSGYDHKAYERIKELSEKQAAEIKQNPGNCKEVTKDGMTCMTCKDPKTGGNYESCSYVAEPKNNQYAYSKEKKFNSNDEPDEPESNEKSEQSKPAKYEKTDDSSEQKNAKITSANDSDENNDDESKYKSYYIHSAKPNPSESLRAAEDNPDDEIESIQKPYNYKKAIPGFYTDNEPKKDVEHVLAEFKKKDRSSCKQVKKNGMTCFQCIDKSGLKNEECMYVSESAPQRSHLAYQEVKEFTSKPDTLENEGAASSSVTTNAPLPKRAAAYVVDNSAYGKKLKRKKAPQSLAASATKPVASVAVPVAHAPKVKRSTESEAEEKAKIVDETNIAPEEFAGDSSKGAYWAETMPRYSAALGVTLPEYMLSRSDHEVSFDETVAGA